MIDNQLIDNQTKHFLKAWNNKKEIIPNLYAVDNVLTDPASIKLRKYISTATSWETVINQERLPRRKISWEADSIIEELHTAFDNITPMVNKSFNDVEKYFLGLQIWEDRGGYKLDYHSDNPVIDIAMQAYLYDCPEQCGTTFNVDDYTIDLPFLHNTGYLLCNNKKMLHKTTHTVPPNVKRYSLYAIWSSRRKNIA